MAVVGNLLIVHVWSNLEWTGLHSHISYISVLAHNATAAERKVTPINTVLCPGLGTAVGRMPYGKAAFQVSLLGFYKLALLC